jgi:SAM-dependent methyltransferase
MISDLSIAERETGQCLFRAPWIHTLFHFLVRKPSSMRLFQRTWLDLPPGSKVIDVGCGPGDARPYLPDVDYVGFDVSERFINDARAKHGGAGRFYVGTAASFRTHPDFRDADVVLCWGVLHHLDDAEVQEVLRFAHRALKPGGLLLGIEPCFLLRQGWLSRKLMELDAGDHIRPERAWRALLGQVFERANTEICVGLTRLPYVHIVLEGRTPTAADAAR